jgi:hypothetical protein
MTVVVIGVNALESTLVEEFDLSHLELSEHGELRIPEGYPLHTEVLWPTIITGLSPSEHGLTRTSAREWENPVLELAAEYSTKIVPEQVLLPIGRQIQKLGFERESNTGAEYYEARGIDTIFADVRSIDIDVPGYSDRGGTDEIRKLMGHSEYEPEDSELFRDACREEFESKRASLFDALDVDVDLIVCYIQALDNLQHVYWSDRELVRNWYRELDELVSRVRERLTSDDVLVLMSDHGMRGGEDGKGEHSDYGYYASTVTLGMESILDLKGAVDDLLEKDSKVSQPV